MWKKVQFYGVEILAWVPDKEIWTALTQNPQPSDKHVLCLIDDDASYRWLLPT